MRISDWSSDVCSSDLERLLRGALENQCSDCEPKGCLGVISSIACGEGAEAIREDVIARRASSRQALIDRLERGKAEGDLSPETDIEGITSCLFAVMQGMAVQAGAGASRAELERLVTTRSEEHTSELQSLMRISYAVFCLK